MKKINAQYNVAAPHSLPVRIAAQARRKMYDLFIDGLKPAAVESILDVGVTSEREYEASNYLEAWFPDKARLTAVGLDDAKYLEELYPGLQFCRADGRRLPFRDGAFDIVHSSAVLEHVGGTASQRQFIGELARVARRAVFITTPNRWFPIEFHSILPLVHWLPKPLFRKILWWVGFSALAREENLNLLSASDIRSLCDNLDGWRVELTSISTFGWPSNLILMLHRV